MFAVSSSSFIGFPAGYKTTVTFGQIRLAEIVLIGRKTN
jgi:hypothetical protein